MAIELRKTGISVIGDIPWGTHFCSFYDTRDDLLDIVVPYFKSGLESKEFCLWVISNSELLTVEEAKSALRKALPDLDRYLAERSIELVGHDEWFLKGGAFDPHSVANGFKEKLDEAMARGYRGMRVNGSPAWLQTEDAKQLREFEEGLDQLFINERIIASCTYPLARTKADHIFAVARRHEFAIARRNGRWEIAETPQLKKAKAEIERLNEELEQRVLERTSELTAANEELWKEISERKQAEALLHVKEQEFRAIVENAPDQLIRYDREFRRTYVNPAVVRAYGLPAEALVGKPIGSVIQDAGLDVKDDELAQVRQRIAAVFDTGKSCEYEMNWPVPTGRRYYGVRLFPELDLNGSVINVLAIARDITERKQAEDALRRSEDRIRLIIDTIPTMAWSLRPDGVVDFANQRWLDYAGEGGIEDPNRIVHPEDLPGVMEKWLANMAAGEPSEDEMRLRRADGVYRWFLVRTAPLRDEQGNLVKWYGVSTDIEDRKQAEEQLKQNENLLAEAQHLTHVGSWNWDLQSNPMTWSDEVYRICGVDPQTYNPVYDQFVREFVHPDDRAFVRGEVENCLKTRKPFSFYHRILRPDGEERIIQARGDVACDQHGNPIRMFGTVQDVTERRQAEERLRATTEQLRALSARIHSAREEEGTRIAREIHDELGAALSSLRWDLEDAAEATSQSGDRSQPQELRKKIEAMMRLTDTTINTVRRIASELRPIALDALGLSEAIELQARQFQERTGIVVHCDCTLENLDLGREQSTAVFRIFQEALTNILRHAQATMVKVQMKEGDSEFILTISDDGRGITDDEKAGKSTLGLLGMRERAHLIEGKIDITGSEGKGTVVTVRIPVSR